MNKKQITIIMNDGKIEDIQSIPDDIEIKIREHNDLLNSTIWSKSESRDRGNKT